MSNQDDTSHLHQKFALHGGQYKWRRNGEAHMLNPLTISKLQQSVREESYETYKIYSSGVFFRSTVDGTKVKGWQVEVAPPGFHSGGIYESYGRGWLVKPESSKDSIVKMGEWNDMKIKVMGDEVTTWINDTEMIKIKDSIIGKGIGGVALQIHDGGGIKVRWKDLKIQKL